MNFAQFLSSDSFIKIFNGEKITPILQLLGYKTHDQTYRVSLSDSTYFYLGCWLDEKLKCKIENNEIDKFSLVKLNDFIIETDVDGRKRIIINDLQLAIKGWFVGEKIANTTDFFYSSFNKMKSNSNQISPNKRPIIEIKDLTSSHNFSLSDLSSQKIGSIIDHIMCISFKVEDAAKFTYQTTGDTGLRRNIHLVDESRNTIVLTLWNNFTKSDIKSDDVLVLKRVKLTNFNSLSLSSLRDTIVQINPDLDDANTLKDWYEKNKATLFQVGNFKRLTW